MAEEAFQTSNLAAEQAPADSHHSNPGLEEELAVELEEDPAVQEAVQVAGLSMALGGLAEQHGACQSLRGHVEPKTFRQRYELRSDLSSAGMVVSSS